MPLLTKTESASKTEATAAPEIETKATVTDRRRPGRLSNVSPELIPILRGQDPADHIEFEDIDQTSALRGLFFGVLFSIPIWVAIAYVGTFFLS